jgi:hypothetical protein
MAWWCCSDFVLLKRKFSARGHAFSWGITLKSMDGVASGLRDDVTMANGSRFEVRKQRLLPAAIVQNRCVVRARAVWRT